MRRPTAEEVAKRLIILKFQIVHALATPPRESLMDSMKGWSEKEKKDFAEGAIRDRENFWRPLRDLGVWRAMSPKERDFAQATVLTMTSQQLIDASWRMESAVVLMWALSLVEEMPSFESQTKTEYLKKVPNNVVEFIKGVSLRSSEVIDHYRELAEFWHWRSRTRQLQEEGRELKIDENLAAQGFRSYDEIIRKASRLGFAKGDLPRLCDGDFAVKGKAYRDLNEEEWSEIRSITMERHFAANWLCGYAPENRWDDTPTDT